ncbi:hypothetical protein XENTR_v10005197 [Xenopus tropicalis]|nr:hypothetical protein XENTR_v10005197 [Xenopus tropicalis]
MINIPLCWVHWVLNREFSTVGLEQWWRASMELVEGRFGKYNYFIGYQTCQLPQISCPSFPGTCFQLIATKLLLKTSTEMHQTPMKSSNRQLQTENGIRGYDCGVTGV